MCSYCQDEDSIQASSWQQENMKKLRVLATARCNTLCFYSHNGSDKTQTLCFYSHNGSDKTKTQCFYSYFMTVDDKFIENQLKLGLASWNPKNAHSSVII